ncbi:MAG: NUDIX domain-containing protein [Lachnospiraceae bacterium]|nr:NUDIX domain-containing protein [Lachnospiraceae bacterium]
MEVFDLYNNFRTPTGKTMERYTEVPEGYYRLVVHVCIFNSKGEMLIQQRQPFKNSWPGLWDLTIGGSVSQGENSQLAASRELAEELGITYDFSREAPAITVSFYDGFDDIFVVNMDIDAKSLTLQPEEVKEAMWADRDKVVAMIDDGSFIPYEKHLIDYLFFLKDRRSTHARDDTRHPDST